MRLSIVGGISMGLALGCVASVRADDAARADRFEKQVRPLLVEHCQKCHGAKRQEGSLRLDARVGITKGGDSGPSVVPGKPDASLLIQAVRHEGDRSMPPDVKLKPHEIAALEEWVKDGAYWPEEKIVSLTRSGPPSEVERSHWSFQPIRRPAIPEVRDAAWSLTPVDRFVLARLESAGLAPQPPADRRTLLRRVTFDLTGLPPTPTEIASFLADDSPDAYARVVERLLASPHYGERWGRHWLDVVRYADTAGDGADYPVPEAHLYRNWVIRAFNADMPFDEFLRQQIAGDILARERATQGTITDAEYADLVTATGYLAVTKRFGYNVNTEFQHLDIADTIETVGRSLLGLSLGCARCHDHKYEPVTAEDYYALYGIFASSTFAFPGGEEHKRPANFVPLATPHEVERLNRERQQELARFDALLKKAEAERTAAYDSVRFAGGIDFGFEGQSLESAPAFPWFTAGPNKVLVDAQSPYTNLHPAGGRGLRLGKGVANEGIRQQFPAISAAQAETLHFNIDFRNVDAPKASGAYRLFLSHGVITTMGIECSVEANQFSIRNGDAWEVVRQLETGAWYNLQLTLDLKGKRYSGRIGRPNDVVEFHDKSFAGGWDGVLDTFISDNLGQKKGTVVTRDIDNLGLTATPIGPVDSKAAPPKEAAAGTTGQPPLGGEKLREQLAAIDARVKSISAERDAAGSRFTSPAAYGVSEGQPHNVKLQRRGEPTNLGQEVPRRWMTLLGGDPLTAPSTGSGRRELAEWIAREDNPLTARVFVNRLWQHHFGTGIVASASDFGLRGQQPSHPELLDWLAHELRHGSIKSLHRMIVLSRTYQQGSADNEAAVAVDSENRLLWKFARRRLSAEEIRDAMLAVSGNLDDRMPGPHPFPPVNTWSFTIHYPFAAHYDHNHRSVYLMVQRAKKHPYLSLFDGADPNLSTDVRALTTTPTQSLFLMNDPFVHAQAQSFARRVQSIEGDVRARLAWAVEAATGQRPDDAQIDEAAAFLTQYEKRLAELGKPPAEQTAVAWNALCRILLTSNGFLFVE
ncbi:MAG: PSD1 domain-containing protein [Planctomycetaceae bacterium]|nr:PSD1 domain-containing protein [Planctomycetaceae bacterium]